MELLRELCELCWQKIDEFNQFYVQVANIQETYNRQFQRDDGSVNKFDDSNKYYEEVEKIHLEFASKMFNNQIDDKKLSYIEPFCVINVDDNNIMTKTPNESPLKIHDFDEKADVIIKEEKGPTEENAGGSTNDSNAIMSDYEDDITFNFEEDEDDDDDDDDGDDENDGDDDDSSSDSSTMQEKKRKSSAKNSKPKKSYEKSKHGEKSSRPTKKYTKKKSTKNFSVTIMDEDNKRLLSYVQMKCDVCSDDRVFDSFSEIQTHFLDNHNQSGYIMCCNRKFRRIGRVLQVKRVIYFIKILIHSIS